jgi:starch-binding outer membrane protein, SusD/RagB family
MRNLHFKILTIGLLIASTSCSGFLDRDPLDQISENTFYKTANEANLGAIAMYSVLQGVNWHGKSWMITEIPGDNTTSGGNDPDFSPIDNFTISPDNGPNAEFWTEHFRIITLANQILKFVPSIDMDEIQKNGLLAEAKFLRAYAYFDLARIYGDVPIIKDVPDINTNVKVSRNKIDEVYSFIIEDLKYSTDHLPTTRSNADLGRATQYAALAILAKVYLTTGKHDDCMMLCRQIINSNVFKLMPDFADNWLRDVSDNNAESIFQVQYVGCKAVGTGNALQAFFAPWGQGITKNSDGWGSQIPTAPTVDNPGTTLKDIYVKDDKRKYHTIMTPLDQYPMINASDGGYTYPAAGASRSGINIKKYVIGSGSDVCFMTSPQNYHAIRYADVLLMLAEASCARNGGISITPDVLVAFNAVRKRAGLAEVASLNSKEVFDERRKEFAFENQRWFDLLRTGKVVETMKLHGKNMQEFHKLFPIPSQEIAINPNLIQNQGYK